jgi:phage protein D
MSLKDIVGEIAGDVGLSPKVGDTTVVLKYVLQNNQTDLEFLQARAARIGYEVFVTDRDLHFQAPGLGQGEEITLSPDQDLIEFYPRLSTMSQVDNFAVRGWDPAKKQEIVSDAKSASSTMGDTAGPNAAKEAFGSSEAARTQSPVFSLEEAEEIAKGRFDEMALAYVSGEGVCIGRTDLRAGNVIGIEGLGQRFSGSYYVTSTTHSITPSQGYRTAFSVRRNAT